mgnify:CR=1 FL=1
MYEDLIAKIIPTLKFKFPYSVEDYGRNLYLENYHCHKDFSNTSTPDCAESIENYAKRIHEFGAKCLYSGEHGSQGNQFEVYKVAEKEHLKYIHSAEAYWVKDRKEKDKADEAFTNIVSMGAILAFIVTLFFFIFASQLISLCGARESSALHNPAVDYLRIIAIGQFFQIMNLGLAGAIRAEGNVRYSMVVSMIGALLNIGLDALFIIVFNAGLQGAAAATALSQVVGATVSALYFTRKKSVLRWAGLKSVRFKKMLEIAGLGAAPAVFQGFGLVNNLITNNSLMIYGNNEMGAGGGDLAISALSVVNTVESIALMVVLGMNNAISTIISYNYGAKNINRVKKTFKLCLISSLIYSAAAWLLLMTSSEVVVKIFNNDPSLLQITSNSIKIYFAGIFIFGAQISCQQTFLSLGKAKISLFLALLRKIILLIPLIFILPMFVDNGLFAVLLAEPVADVIAALTTVACFTVFYKKTLSKININENNKSIAHF